MGTSADLAIPIIFMILLIGVTSRDIEVFVNDYLSITCSPNESIDIQWHFNSPYNFVYAGGKLRYPYDSRFRSKRNETTGEYYLIIPKVTLEDAGLYMCSEELTGRRIRSTQLTVLYMKPACSSNMDTDGFIGPNTCSIQQETMMFSCDVVFNGIPPHLSWRSANDNQTYNSSPCEVTSNRSRCSFTLRADPSYDGSIFRCDVGQMKLDDRRFSCNTERIKVHYFFGDHAHEKKYVHETAVCVVRSNLNVRYNWTLQQDDEEIFLTSNQTVSIKNPGLHQCVVRYSIRNVTCSTLLSVVNATEAIPTTYPQNEQSTTLLAVILTIALVSVIALIGSIIYNLKQGRHCIYKSRPEGPSDHESSLDPLLVNNRQLFEYQDKDSEEGRWKMTFDRHQDFIVDRMSPDFGLIDELYSNSTITDEDKDHIKAGKTVNERNEYLIKRLGGRYQLGKLIEGLGKTDQKHLVKYLENDGNYVDELDGEWSLTEKEILRIKINHKSLSDLIEMSDLLSLLYSTGVINKRQREFISSKSTSYERNEALLEILRRGSLRSYWQTIRCLHQSNQSHTVEMLETGGDVKDWIVNTCLSNLPLEMIDVILQKAYLHSITRQRELMQNRVDEVVIKQLASVAFFWFKRITGKRVKNAVWSSLKKFYEDNYKVSLIYKNNQQFFEEFIQISGKTNRTASTDDGCLRSSKKRLIEFQTLRTAFLATKNDNRSFKSFNRCFGATEYDLISEIRRTGGGAARVEIKMSRPLSEFELIPQQFEDGVKILTSLSDRDAVMWIWCPSNNALQELDNQEGTEKLVEIVCQSVKTTSNVLMHKTNIDSGHLKKNLVLLRKIRLNFRAKLNFLRKTSIKNRFLAQRWPRDSDILTIFDVTKLKMRVYVLCLVGSLNSIASTICVFEDRDPYSFLEEISLDKLSFKSLVSSVKTNCLYLLQYKDDVSEVIRIKVRQDEENSRILQRRSQWLELDEGYRLSALSISKDGDLMMVNSSSPIILRIYSSNARLHHSAYLHEDIEETLKATETSNGNFIIMHIMKRQIEDIDDVDRTQETNKKDALEEEKSSFCSSLSDMAKGTNKENRAHLWTVSEVSRDGKMIIRRFIPQNQQLNNNSFSYAGDLCADSKGRVFVADTDNDRVIVLDSYLRWIGILIAQIKNWDEIEKLHGPSKLFYDEDSHEMIIAGKDQVKIYKLIYK